MFEKKVQQRSGRGGNGGFFACAFNRACDCVVVFSGTGSKNVDSPSFVSVPDLSGSGAGEEALPKPPVKAKPGIFKVRSGKGFVSCSTKPSSVEREADMENRFWTHSFRSNSSAGFVLTALLVMLPVFLTALMGFCSLIFCLKNYNLAQSWCISSALQSQRQMKQKLTELLSLNPRADSLRNQYRYHLRWLKKSLKAGDLVTAGLVASRIKTIQLQRMKLHHRQQKIFHQSLKKMKESVRRFHKKMLYFSSVRKPAQYLRPYPLAVKATGSVLAPSYKIPFSFSAKQKLSLFWDMPLYRFLPGWLRRWLFKPDLFSSYRCSATLKGNHGHFQVALSFYKKSKGLRRVFESLSRSQGFGGLK